MQLTKDKDGNFMDFRTLSLEMILYAINSGANLLSGGGMYVKAIKRELIGQYAETFILDRKEIKLYGKSVKSLGNMWQVILVSEKCIEELHKGNEPYYEHIEPLSRIYANICSLPKKNMTSLQNEMKYCKIVGLSRGEKAYLDMKPNNYFTHEDEQLLKAWEPVIGHNVTSAIDSIKDPITGTMLNTQKSGTAYARIAHLVNHGARFVWMADPCARAGKSQIEQIEIIKDYLENTCYKYNYEKKKKKWK